MVAVEHGSDTGKAHTVRPEMYQTYYHQPGYENGHVYYVSSDDKYAIYRTSSGTNGLWVVGYKSNM